MLQSALWNKVDSFILHIWLLENSSSTDNCRIQFFLLLFFSEMSLNSSLLIQFCTDYLGSQTFMGWGISTTFHPQCPSSPISNYQTYHIFLSKIWNLFCILVLIAVFFSFAYSRSFYFKLNFKAFKLLDPVYFLISSPRIVPNVLYSLDTSTFSRIPLYSWSNIKMLYLWPF